MRLRPRMLGKDLARRWVSRSMPGDGEGRRSRVLLEVPDGAEALAYWRLLTNNGYDVEWCPGPEGPPALRCPLVTSGHCELIDRADVVVSALGLDQEPCRHVIESRSRLHPETPVVTQASREAFTRWAELVEGDQPLPTPVCGEALLGSVQDALADR
ncbi:MAG TPA: hypothetical protein VNC61_05255 [Acidimicrobiales bacterium]|nr:hypothetical protein [Acidimicrobiales bacterium]